MLWSVLSGKDGAAALLSAAITYGVERSSASQQYPAAIAAALRFHRKGKIKMRYVTVLTSVLLTLAWVFLSHREPFPSHLELKALGLIVFTMLAGIVFGLVKHWRGHKDS